MAHTLVGVYDNYQNAQATLKELLNSGFEIENVRLSPEEESLAARQRALRHDETTQGSHGVMGFFRSLFDSEAAERQQHTDMYSEAVRRGSYLLTIHTNNDEQADSASAIMNRHQPVDIDERVSVWRGDGWSGYDRSTAPFTEAEIAKERSRLAGAAGLQSATPAGKSTLREKTSIPVMQEELQVGKREVQRGGVRVYQHVTQTPVQETLNLREEHVSVERHAMNQPATEADLSNLKERSFEMRETAEEAVVAKSVRVVEEVVLGKEVSEHAETISDTVRRSDVEIQRISGQADDAEYRSHWTAKYGAGGGRYEDFAPAYEYGARIAAVERYRGHRFSDMEPDIECDWTARNIGHPWAKVKESVRYAWERVTR